ncbi:hypothetical protein RND81_11G071600 [Saponaria officinalis]|uniref:Disease resistance R13L4/SHOC-2-like LRR domain-containing protein n=1 Tax=Saponaria officinalis TaxID=3572 RepID=A0AAW1HIX0_SAPOF
MSTTTLFSSLMSHGKTLALLLRDPTNKLKTVDNIPEAVDRVINDLLAVLERDRAEFSTEECFTNVVQKIEWCLHRFTDFDPQNASLYRDLATKVGKFLTTKQPVTYNNNDNNNNNSNSSNNNNVIYNNDNNLQDFNVSEAYDRLTKSQKWLLFFFYMHPGGAELKIKDFLIYWYMFDEVADDFPIDYESLEQKCKICIRMLVEMKFINVVAATARGDRIRNRKVGLRYQMSNGIRFKLKEEGVRFIKRNSMSLMGREILSNVNAVKLNAKTLNWLSNSSISVLNLGNWNGDPTKYIVVEDMEALKNVLSSRTTIKFLSLKGISGIVELPNVVYKHKLLIALDLSGCPNLESLTEGIHALKYLLFLDLSECYLLDHIPRGISQLSELRVLKGFIITQAAVAGSMLRNPLPSSALLSDLSPLKKLRKLTIRTREMNFPTSSDLRILCELQSLTHLKITWAGTSSTSHRLDADAASKFPCKITKFEMEAATESTATQLLELIVRQKDPIPLKNLYIRGGHLRKLVPDIECKILRLQYLPSLEINCYEMMRSFPNLHRLEMSMDVIYSLLRQSFKIATSSHDRDIVWKPSLTSRVPSIE